MKKVLSLLTLLSIGIVFNCPAVFAQAQISAFIHSDAIPEWMKSTLITSKSTARYIVPVSGDDISALMLDQLEPKQYLRDFIEEAHKNQKQVFLAVDCLNWANKDNVSRALLENPELAERDFFGDYQSPARGRYASPFNSRVNQQLHNAIDRIATQYPKLDGIVLRCSLPLGTPLLGYSNAAIDASKQATGIDPIEVNLSGNEEETKIARRWIEWRLSSVAALVNDLATTFHNKNPNGKVAIIGFARWSQLKEGKKNTTLEDWPRWLKDGQINEVVLEDRWGEIDKDAFSRATNEVHQVNKAVKVTAILPLDQVKSSDDLKAVSQVLGGQALNVMLESSGPDDLDRVQSVVAALSSQTSVTPEDATPKQSIESPKLDTAATLSEGQPAPNFEVRDMNGRLWRLNDLKGKKNLLLTFFPKCFTGGCEKHLESIERQREGFDAQDTQILAVSVDTPEVQVKFANSLGLSFPLVPDPQRTLCSLYGATKNTKELAERMSVFIDKNGIVKWIDRNVNVNTHGEDVLARIKQQ